MSGKNKSKSKMFFINRSVQKEAMAATVHGYGYPQ